jgi:hypothetical protein
MRAVCKCGARLAQSNKSGRCHLCATRVANGTRVLPPDFAEHAIQESNVALMERYNCCGDIITRWRKESGVLSKRVGRTPMSVPTGFHMVAATLTKKELRQRYGLSHKAINRLLEETGTAARRVLLKPEPLLPQPGRDLTRATMAADYLRKFAAVTRCNERGQFDPKGAHWRRGPAVLCADEIIARALRQGWNPDSWREVRAA